MKQWIDHVLSELFGRYIAEYLLGYGMEVAIVALVAPVLAFVGVKAFWGVLTPAPEPDWENLNPDDDRLMQSALGDLHTVASLARLLNENDAATLDDFKAQIRRAGLYRTRDALSQRAPPKESLTTKLRSSLRALIVWMLALAVVALVAGAGFGIAAFRHWKGWW